ncbi:hypothetical protein [Nonlabens spongiae]|uniref:hypothetical protein n=1 Tax=Nonlabens spongiae TaxID=331648 RepID=UPI0012F5110A|nr:hypothetical protein [Nonlabens spongiae]
MIKYFTIPLFCLLVSCASQKTDVDSVKVDDSDYNMSDIYAQNWMGGAPGSSTGTDLYIPTRLLGDPVEVHQVIYKGKSTTQAEYTDISRATVVAHFKDGQKDSQMTENPEGEYGNELPIMNPKAKNLKDDEALIVFSRNGKRYEKVIKNVKQKPALPYPSMPSNQSN